MNLIFVKDRVNFLKACCSIYFMNNTLQRLITIPSKAKHTVWPISFKQLFSVYYKNNTFLIRAKFYDVPLCIISFRALGKLFFQTAN